MKKDQVWAVRNYDKGKVEKVFHKKHEAIDYAEENEDCAVASVDLSSLDEDDKVQFGPFGVATVREILDAMDEEDPEEEINLRDDPTPDEEEDACKAYGLKKPE